MTFEATLVGILFVLALAAKIAPVLHDRHPGTSSFRNLPLPFLVIWHFADGHLCPFSSAERFANGSVPDDIGDGKSIN